MKISQGSPGRFSRQAYGYRSAYSYLRTLIRAGMFWKRFPVVNRYTSQIQPLFIIGSGRSGNTLVRAMLAAHGDIAMPPESYVLGGLVDEYQRFNHLSWPVLARLILSKFESHPGFVHWNMNLQPLYARAANLEERDRTLAGVIDLLYRAYAEQKQPQAIKWGDKTPVNTLRLENIYQVFPNAYYLHILRDGRDAVLSYLKTGFYSKLEDAALRWLVSVENARCLQKILPAQQFLEIRYEDVVQHPEKTMGSVCAFLSIDYRGSMLDFWKMHDALGDTTLDHHANIQNPLNNSSIGKWKDGFTPEQQSQIRFLLGNKLTQLGYEV